MKNDIRFSGGYHQDEEKRQEYRSLKFWSPFLTWPLIISLIIVVASQNNDVQIIFRILFFLLLVIRIGLAIAKAYYRKVYNISE